MQAFSASMLDMLRHLNRTLRKDTDSGGSVQAETKPNNVDNIALCGRLSIWLRWDNPNYVDNYSTLWPSFELLAQKLISARAFVSSKTF